MAKTKKRKSARGKKSGGGLVSYQRKINSDKGVKSASGRVKKLESQLKAAKRKKAAAKKKAASKLKKKRR